MAIPFISLIFIFLPILKCDAKISSLIVFGDSTVDSGNNNNIATILKSNFEPYGRDFDGRKATGRFSNGRVATDFISEAFGLKGTIPAYLDPAYTIQDFATGVCFASAGTGYDNFTSQIFNVIPLWKELEYYKQYQSQLRDYLGNHRAEEVLRQALHLISMGTNDFIENYYLHPKRSSEFTIEEYQKFLASIARTFVTHLYELGARKVAVVGLVPMGCLPLERTTNLASMGDCRDEYNNVAMDYNKKLHALVENLNKDLSGLHLVLTDIYPIVSDIIQNPHSFGFEDSEKGCCGTGRMEMSYLCEENNPFTCLDASKYVFWDSVHPSDKTNAIVADYAMRQSLAVFK